MGATWQIVVAKKAAHVVDVVNSIAPAASGKAMDAIVSVDALGLSLRAFFHLSTATKTSSAPNAAATKTPIKFKNGKLMILIRGRIVRVEKSLKLCCRDEI